MGPARVIRGGPHRRNQPVTDRRAAVVGTGPEAAAGPARLALEGGEERGVPQVRRDPQRPGVTVAEQLSIDHAVADPHVGEQPPVSVARFRVQLEADASVAQERRV